MKTCTKCKETKPVSEFTRDKSKKDGLRTTCKACHKAYREANKGLIAAKKKAWAAANKESIAAKKKAWRQSNKESIDAQKKAWDAANPDKVKGYQKAYREANKEKVKAYQKAWAAANPDKVKAYHKAYFEANKEKVKSSQKAYREASKVKRRAYEHARRARKENAQGTHTAEQWQARLDYFGHKCRYCGSRDNIECEHQIPLSRGGSNWPANLAPACKSCNCGKGTKTHLEFLRELSDGK